MRPKAPVQMRVHRETQKKSNEDKSKKSRKKKKINADAPVRVWTVISKVNPRLTMSEMSNADWDC
jgi:hypothetical protein